MSTRTHPPTAADAHTESRQRPGRLPGGFFAWSVASSVSTLGTAVLSFAIGWYATGYGATVAGLVGSAVLLPRVVLILVGGALADRWGPRQAMIAGDAVMVASTVALAITALTSGVHVWLLAAAALAGGVVDAIYIPASGALPRLFVPDHQLARALAVRTGLGQVAYLAGPAAGAALVALGGLAGAAVSDAVTFTVVLVVLVVVRPPIAVPPRTEQTSVRRDIAASLRSIAGDRALVVALAAVGALAAGVLPLFGLGAPLLAREHGWGPAGSGAIEAAWFVATLAVTVVVGRWGTSSRAGTMAIAGPIVAAVGAATLALATALPVAVAGCFVLGVGVAACTSHLAPVLMTRVPRDQLGRFQSVFVFVQMAPLLISNNALGALGQHAGANAIFAGAAALCLLTSALLASRRDLRHLRSPVADAAATAADVQPAGG